MTNSFIASYTRNFDCVVVVASTKNFHILSKVLNVPTYHFHTIFKWYRVMYAKLYILFDIQVYCRGCLTEILSNQSSLISFLLTKYIYFLFIVDMSRWWFHLIWWWWRSVTPCFNLFYAGIRNERINFLKIYYI